MWTIILSVCVLHIACARQDKLLWEPEGPHTMEDDIVDEQYSNDFGYRLPPYIKPLEYEIFLDMYFDERTEKPYSYDGYVNITIKPLAFVQEIVLNSMVDIHGVKLVSNITKEIIPLMENKSFILEPKYQMITINLEEVLDLNDICVLSINFSKSFYEDPLYGGPFKGYYYDANGTERVYLSAYLQPHNARHVFPCFDEPAYKSVFILHISRPASYRGTFSNTAVKSVDSLSNNRIRDNFHPTPVMSSYNVAFLVSEDFQVIAQNDSFTPAIRVIGTPTTAGLGDHALKLIVDIVQYFDKYFNISYSSFHPYLMNDHVASPDWATKGTENWGLVTYREIYPAMNLSETPMNMEVYVSTLFTHELAHQWFGNLITCDWWSNTWLNEGFASYFGLEVSNKLFPKYEISDRFNMRYLYDALSYDSKNSAKPMFNNNVNTLQQTSSQFNIINYAKAASVLRMLADIITPETFQKACQIFLKSNAYSTVEQHDFLIAFESALSEHKEISIKYPNFHFQEYYNMWIKQSGYPLLTVHVDHTTGEIKLYQDRYNNPESNMTYPIPITYSSKSYQNFENVIPTIIMTQRQMLLYKSQQKEWVIFNHMQRGYYRVTYDDTTWSLLTEALLNTKDDIHHLNRAQIVDDVFAFMRDGKMSLNRGFKILRFLRYEDNLYVWLAAFRGYKWIKDKIRHLPTVRAEFDAFVLSYLGHAVKVYGFEPAVDETPTASMARREFLKVACDLGHEECIDDAVRRFIAWRDSGTWVSPQIRLHVYKTGIRKGGKDDFDFLLSRFNQSKSLSDKYEILKGLAVTQNADLLDRYLDLTVSKAVRPHDKLDAFYFAADESPALVLDYVKRNIAAIRVGYTERGTKAPLPQALAYLATRLNEEGLAEYEKWANAIQPKYVSLISIINFARNAIKLGRGQADTILQAIRDGAATTEASKMLMFIMVFWLFQIL